MLFQPPKGIFISFERKSLNSYVGAPDDLVKTPLEAWFFRYLDWFVVFAENMMK